jgi:dTDP-4-amino-4,6-dideoxygalactose transaminase
LVDVDNSFNIDPLKIEEKITKKTKAILPVHLFGQASQINEILKLGKKYKLSVVEDAAQAHGASVGEEKVGSFGDLGCFSFYATKNMTTGEGGMITTRSKKLYEKLLLLRNIGMRERYRYELIGYNYRMTEIQAAMGLIQLKKLSIMNERRKRNAKVYNNLLEKIPEILLPHVDAGANAVYHQYCILLNNSKVRSLLQEYLASYNIQTAIYYPNPINEISFYKNNDVFPVADDLSKRILAIPVHPGITVKDAELIAEKILSFFRNFINFVERSVKKKAIARTLPIKKTAK